MKLVVIYWMLSEDMKRSVCFPSHYMTSW